ncbi:MAG: hypothetical protein AAGU06_03425 [Candidatus Shapirobacteria bacterium]
MNNEKKTIIRAGCFEGNKEDSESLCQVLNCHLTNDCIWKREKVESSNLGSDNNRTEAMMKIG